MDKQKLFTELERNFDLKKNHILILDALSKDDYQADKLAKDTGIPLGRIYEFLNYLLDVDLIEKKQNFPAIYSIGRLEDKIIDFIKKQDERLGEKEKRLLGIFKEDKEIEQIEYITDKERYSMEVVKLISDSREMRSIMRYELLPQLLYPLDEEEFSRLRNYFGGKRKTIHSRKVDSSRILTFRAMKEAFGKGKKILTVTDKYTIEKNMELYKKFYGDKYKAAMKEMENQFKKYPNGKVYVAELASPIQVDIGEDRVLLGISHFGSLMGILIRSKKVVDFYRHHFEELVAQSKPISQYIKN